MGRFTLLPAALILYKPTSDKSKNNLYSVVLRSILTPNKTVCFQR
ncbi:hypothetical protein VVMO6_03672 [Vibrio vulnificus MO6-24/O]|nr:hypothetical protein VVMO6_03672 [Vibrio vulnificus MO6-24/O]